MKNGKKIDKCFQVAEKIACVYYQKELLEKVHQDYCEQYKKLIYSLNDEDRRFVEEYVSSEILSRFPL